MTPIVAAGGDALSATRAGNPAGFWFWTKFNVILFVIVPLIVVFTV